MRRRAWTIGTTALALGGLMWASHQSGVLSTLTGTRLSAVRSWGYQLQNLDKTFDALAASDTDLLVVDFSMSQAAGRPMKPLDPAEVERLKTRPDGGRRIVLAYFSIGEAEEYRFYWNKPLEDAAAVLAHRRELPLAPQSSGPVLGGRVERHHDPR
ncbi:MAG: hypothetical protein C0511_13165 [Hyphomicrobium sp.]|nr:hypothetical protein [Hyphomicrobium sp.]PPC80712.1 MAG: hypothetical protein CTY40_08700 [Hyphomicrobium sp.]